MDVNAAEQLARMFVDQRIGELRLCGPAFVKMPGGGGNVFPSAGIVDPKQIRTQKSAVGVDYVQHFGVKFMPAFYQPDVFPFQFFFEAKGFNHLFVPSVSGR